MGELKGKVVKIRLSEPWDLGESIQWNPLVAVIIDEGMYEEFYSPQRIAALMLELQTPLVHDDSEFKFIHGSARFEGESILDLRRPGDRLHGTFICIPTDKYVEGSLDVSWWRGGLAIIGELELL